MRVFLASEPEKNTNTIKSLLLHYSVLPNKEILLLTTQYPLLWQRPQILRYALRVRVALGRTMALRISITLLVVVERVMTPVATHHIRQRMGQHNMLPELDWRVHRLSLRASRPGAADETAREYVHRPRADEASDVV
jgi:hypothetical protein